MAKEIQHRSYRAARNGPASIDEKNRSVEAVIATENPVMVMDNYGWEMIREVLLMSGLDSVPSSVPLLDSHDRGSCSSVLGSTREISIRGSELLARNFFASDPDSVAAFDKVRDGHIKDNSIGYSVHGYQDLKPGEERLIGNQTFMAGNETLRVVTSWSLRENSVTPIGADPMAKMRSRSQPGEAISDRDFLAALGMRDDQSGPLQSSSQGARSSSLGDPSDADLLSWITGDRN